MNEIAYTVDGVSHNCRRSGCSRPIPRVHQQSRAHWLAKKYCSHKCANVGRHDGTVFEPRSCPYCATPLLQREGEDAYNFARRKFCDRHCARAQQAPPLPKGTFLGHAGYQPDGELRALARPFVWPVGLRYTDDPRAVRDAYPAKVVPNPEWAREV